MIDTHVHVVASDPGRYPLDRFDHPGGDWVESAPDVAAFASAMAAAGIDGAVLVQPHGAYRDDNSYVCDAAAAHEELRSVVIIDMASPHRRNHLARWIDRGASGLRLFSVPTPATPWIDDPSTDMVWSDAADAGLTIGVCVLPDELEQLTRRVSRAGDTPVVVDHCGFVPLHDSTHPSTQQLRRLGTSGRVWFKVTTHVIDAWCETGQPAGELLPRLVAWFGAERLVWGSDYAQTHDRSYGELVDLARSCFDGLDDVAASQVAHTNAASLWRF